MAEWQELEERFKQLIPEMKNSFIQVQSGGIPEKYRLGGPEIGHLETEFLALSASAGELLIQNSALRNPKILSEENPETRWFKALYLETKQIGSPMLGTQTVPGEEPKAFIIDRIREPARVSSSYCGVQGLKSPKIMEPEPPGFLKEILWFSPKNIWRYKWQLLLVAAFTLLISHWGEIWDFLANQMAGEPPE